MAEKLKVSIATARAGLEAACRPFGLTVDEVWAATSPNKRRPLVAAAGGLQLATGCAVAFAERRFGVSASAVQQARKASSEIYFRAESAAARAFRRALKLASPAAPDVLPNVTSSAAERPPGSNNDGSGGREIPKPPARLAPGNPRPTPAELIGPDPNAWIRQFVRDKRAAGIPWRSIAVMLGKNEIDLRRTYDAGFKVG